MLRSTAQRRQSDATADGGGIVAARSTTAGEIEDSSYGDIDLGMLLSVLLRQWWLIILVTALSVGAGYVYLKVAPREWQSTARVLLDPRDKQVTGPSVAQPVQGIDTFWIDTQADIVKSTATLDAVIDRLKLMSDPEFSGDRDDTRRKLVGSIRVERADQTYVLDISATTRDPERSARIAEAMAEAFVDGMIAIKAQAVRQASQLIDHQLDELRTAARQAQEKLEAYKRDNGLLSVNGRQFNEDTLRQLNDAYVAAQVKTRDAKARRDGFAAALKSGDAGIVDASSSPVLSRLKIDAAQASRTYDDLAQQLGPNHPRLIAAKADVARTQGLINAELKSLSANANGDYAMALAAEEAARKAVDEATNVVANAGEAGITLKELENEATLRGDLYRNYMTRTAEIGLQANTQVSDARVIVPASVPFTPSAPRKTIIMALAGLAGLGLGLSFALYRGRRRFAQLLADRTRRNRSEPVVDDEVPDERPEPNPTREPEPAPTVSALAAPAAAAVAATALAATSPSSPETTEPESQDPAPPSPDAASADETPKAPLQAETQVPDEPSQEIQAPDIPSPDVPPAGDSMASVAVSDDQKSEPVADTPIAVLAELSVATAATGPNRLGRVVPRRARDILASAVELASGQRHADGEAAMTRLVAQVSTLAGGARFLITLGVSDSLCAAAIAYGLAGVEPEDKRGVLLVDASYDRLPLSAAWRAQTPDGIVDVLDHGIDAAGIAICPPERDLTVVAVGPVEAASRIDARASDIATFIRDLAGDYGRLILHFGHRHSIPLLEAMIGSADAVLVVAESLVESDPESKAAILDLAGAIPVFAGLVLVEERAATRAGDREAS